MSNNANLVVVPFDDKEGRTQGDSCWSTDVCVPYTEAMTVKRLREQALTKLMSDWSDGGEFSNINEFAKQYDVDCTGGWVVDKLILDIINSGEWDVGNDSAAYAIAHALKCQVEAAAKFIIENED